MRLHPIARPLVLFCSLTMAVGVVLAARTMSAANDDNRPGGKGEVKKAERIECVLTELGSTYRLQSKSKKPVTAFGVSVEERLGAAFDKDDPTQVLLTPKKEGAVELTLDVHGASGSDKERVMVVVLKRWK
jgi:hypothetical protein